MSLLFSGFTVKGPRPVLTDALLVALSKDLLIRVAIFMPFDGNWIEGKKVKLLLFFIPFCCCYEGS